ncbi:hypothetical protein BDW66DRAFT_158157 [Aspergillus desertorum]
MPAEAVIKITGMRKPGLDESSFHEQIDQFDTFTSHAENMQMSTNLADLDYIVQFAMDNIEHFERLWEDEDFRRAVKSDHVNFADETNSGISIGYRTRFIVLKSDELGRLRN